MDPGPLEPMIGDPGDHRPNSRWRLVVESGDEAGPVDGLALLVEQIAVGDRIPLHTHPTDELIVLIEGEGQVRLGAGSRGVTAGTAVFVPAGTPHGTANVGSRPLELSAVFPTTVVEIAMLERNPAPGTEAELPRRTRYDFRRGAFEVLE
ncbi:MAG: cupin domain-containing protein [Candidatus Limnocylindria bacterium]